VKGGVVPGIQSGQLETEEVIMWTFVWVFDGFLISNIERNFAVLKGKWQVVFPELLFKSPFCLLQLLVYKAALVCYVNGWKFNEKIHINQKTNRLSKTHSYGCQQHLEIWKPFCLSTKSANLVSFSKEQFSNIFLDTPGTTKKMTS
jgi:hypothetical protein